MAITGAINGFYFDPEVFSDYLEQQSTFKNAIIVSGIVKDDPTILSLIGEKGNVGTLPFYNPIDADSDALNHDGSTDNVPQDITGGKQTFMAIRRMKAWKDKDITRELTGANPLENVGSKVTSYWQTQWQKTLVGIMKAVLSVGGDMANHVTDKSILIGTITDDNKIAETDGIDLTTKALGDKANQFTIAIMHSIPFARLVKLKLVGYNKYTVPNAMGEITLPVWNNLIVVVDDAGTVDNTVSGYPVYYTFLAGIGAFLSSDVAIENRVEVDRDAETDGGISKLYVKDGKVLHPNGVSIKADDIVAESPTNVELFDAANWELKFNHQNVRLAMLKTNG